MKEQLNLTIESGILHSLRSLVDNVKIKDLNQAVELTLLRGLNKKALTKALILAGGRGERLKPITDEIPKPLLPVHGKPIVQHIINLLQKQGINEVYLSIGYKGEKIKEYFGDGSRFGIKIKYIEEQTPLGTAGPLRLAKPFLTETFVMCNADGLINIDITGMYLFHKQNNAKATIALTTVPDPSHYGVVVLEENRIVEFIEKPQNPVSNLINAGFYILEPEVIDMIPEGFSMIEKDVFPRIALQKQLCGYSFLGQWMDTGTFERYAQAIKDWKDFD